MGLTGITLAYMFYIKRPELAQRAREAMDKPHEVVDNKYYVDEGYDWAFVQGSIKSGKLMTFFDQHILDGVLVNGVAATMATLGRGLRNLQSGDVQRYATYLTTAVVLALVAIFMMT